MNWLDPRSAQPMTDEVEAVSQSRFRRKPRWLAGALAVVAVVAGAAFAGLGPFSRDDWRGPGTGVVTVKVVKGDTVAGIGRSLVTAGSVRTVKAFVKAAESDPDLGRRIQPGTYAMRQQMSARQALVRFFESDARIETVVRVPDGKRASAVLRIIAEQTGLPLAKLQWAAEKESRTLPNYAQGSIEGFLLPATYRFDPDATALSVIAEIVRHSISQHRAAGLTDATIHDGFNARQTLVIASLLQAEAYPRDYSKVARVVYNRLDIGMPLQFDSTLNYALGTSKLTFTNAERRNPSAYNTYVHTGLPPGPIRSPVAAAIKAAMDPADGKWRYFVTTDLDTGLTEFAVTDAEFIVLREKFRAWLASKQ